MDTIFRVSVERCIACGKCELACAFSHGEDGLPAVPRIRVFRLGPERGVPLTCLQCHAAACIDACPVAALARDEASGAVALAVERCVRCGLCVAACPFGNMVPAGDGRVAKCDLCGGAPRCAAFCPTGALALVPVESARAGQEARRGEAAAPARV